MSRFLKRIFSKPFFIKTAMLGTSYVAFTDAFYCVRSVDGISMLPTLNTEGEDTDIVLLNRFAASSLDFERGEVVILVSPRDPKLWLIKRVVATAGDRVKYGFFNEWTEIPEGHVWVEGDNHKVSQDSKHFGPIPTGLIAAKASFVLWPPKRWGKLEKKEVGTDRLFPAEEMRKGKIFFENSLAGGDKSD